MLPPYAQPVRRVGLPALPYFGVTFAWTWALWWTAALASSLDQPAGMLLYMAGGLGPLAGAIYLLRQADGAYRLSVVRRVWDPRGIAARWWLALVAVTAGPAAIGTLVASLAGVEMTVPTYGAGAVAGVLVVALLAGLAEEPGWRGVALDAWQRRMAPVWAGAGIGVVWALWHLPLAFIEGSYYHALGFASLEFWLTLLALVLLGVLYVWLANGSGHSILIAILAHAAFNVAASLTPRSTVGDLSALFTLTAATVVVVGATRGRLAFTAPSSDQQ